MTIQPFFALYPAGMPLGTVDGVPEQATGATINAAGEGMFVMCQAPKAGNIQKIHAMSNTVASSETITGGFQTISGTDGNPDGTWLSSGNAKVDVLMSANDTWYEWDLTTNKITVTKGEKLAIVFEPWASWSSGDIDFSTIRGLWNPNSIPYSGEDTGAGWPTSTKTTNEMQHIVLEYDDGSIEYIPGLTGFAGVPSAGLIALDGTPPEAGLKFELLSEIEVCGVAVHIELNNDDFKIFHYDDGEAPAAGDTLIATSWDGDIEGKDHDAGEFFLFDSPQTWGVGVHRLTFRPDSTGSPHITLSKSAVVSDAWKGSYGIDPSVTDNWDWTEDNGAGGWTDDGGYLPCMTLLVSGVHDGAGGAGVNFLFHGGTF